MLIGPQSYEHTFRDIQQSLQSSDEKNVIICASTAECDSVCGVRILQVSGVYEDEDPAQLRASCTSTLVPCMYTPT